MASAIDSLRESWDRKNPSEQRLLAILAVVLVGIGVFLMVEKISDGMAEIEANNAKSREALQAMSRYRHIKARAKVKGETVSKVVIPETAKPLDVYLNDILKEMEIQSPSFPEVRENPIGKYTELSFEIELKQLNIAEVGELLERIETGNTLVVVKELSLDTSFRDKEKLDLEVTIATYIKKPEKKSKKSDSDADGKDKDDDEGEEG